MLVTRLVLADMYRIDLHSLARFETNQLIPTLLTFVEPPSLSRAHFHRTALSLAVDQVHDCHTRAADRAGRERVDTVQGGVLYGRLKQHKRRDEWILFCLEEALLLPPSQDKEIHCLVTCARVARKQFGANNNSSINLI